MSKRLFESFQDGSKDDKVFKKRVRSQRGNRLTIEHLLKLRHIRERKKLRKLKDIKLYNIMYSSNDEGGGF